MSIRTEIADFSGAFRGFLAESVASAEKMCAEVLGDLAPAREIGEKIVDGIAAGTGKAVQKMDQVTLDDADKVAEEIGKGGKEFFTGVAYSGEMTIDGLTQLFNAVSPADLPELNIVDLPRDSRYAQIGVIAGMTAQFALVSYGVGAAFGAAGMKTGFSAALGRSTMTGLALGLMKPVPEGKNYWENKATDLAIGIGSGIVGATAGHALSKVSWLGESGHRNLLQSMASKGIPGLPKGAVQANLRAVLQRGRLATVEETAEGMWNSGTAGAVGAGFTHIAGSIHDHFSITPADLHTETR